MKRQKAVSFGGGEPLQYDDLFAVLERLRGTLFRSLTSNGTVRVWDVVAAQARHCFRWHTRWVTCLAVAPDGMTAAAGSADHSFLWDLEG